MPIMFGRVDAEVVALAIPIMAVMGGVLIAITVIIMNARRKDLIHRERILALEKGLPIPDDAPVRERPRHSNRRASGLTLAGIGLALTIALWTNDGAETGVWGLIPLFMGIGQMIAGAMDKRELERERKSDTPPAL